MEVNLIYEIIGYTASLLVVVSLMMSAIVKLRIVNMIGAFTFSVYGLLIGSIPVAAMNGFIVFINIYYLLKIYRDHEFFKLLEVDGDSEYTRAFIEFYRKDILGDQPAYDVDRQRSISLFVLRDMVPAGLLQGNIDGNGVLTIDLDYVIPNYRDFKIGKYLFNEKLTFFRSKNIQSIKASAGSPAHNKYLEKVGFKETGEDEDHPYALPM